MANGLVIINEDKNETENYNVDEASMMTSCVVKKNNYKTMEAMEMKNSMTVNLDEQIMMWMMGDNVEENVPNENEHVPSDKLLDYFVKKFRPVIWAACTKAGMPLPKKSADDDADLDREVVEQTVLEKFARGKFHYNPANGSQKGYVYKVAQREALDYLYRGKYNKYTIGIADEDWARLSNERKESYYGEEDVQVWVREALNRLAKDMKCDRQSLEILVRYVVGEEDRTKLAVEYGYRTSDSISVIKNRWLPKLQAYTKMVMKEDQEGRLRTSPCRIGFLKPFLKWL